jgi:hypothetical protein
VDLGRGLVLLAEFREAERYLAEAVKGYRKSPPRSAYHSGWAECWYGASLAGQRSHDKAEAQLLAAERNLRTAPMTPRRHYQQAVEQLVRLYQEWGKPEKGREWKAKRDKAAK